MARLDVPLIASLLLALAGCGEKRKDFIPTEIQPPPSEIPRIIGGPAPSTQPDVDPASQPKPVPLKTKSI